MVPKGAVDTRGALPRAVNRVVAFKLGSWSSRNTSVLRPMCTKSPKVWATGPVVHGEVPFFVLTSEALRLWRYVGFYVLDDMHVVAWPVSDTRAHGKRHSSFFRCLANYFLMLGNFS